MNSISLFSSSGIGDLGVKVNNINIVASCELLKKRHDLFHENNPNTRCFTGDIWELKDDIIQYYKQNFSEELFLILATPPCQGMSSNGAGKLLNEFRRGNRKSLDERNRLIIPAIEVIKELKPKWVIFENVPNMTNTVIEDSQGNLVNIIEYVFDELSSDYVGKAEVIDVADYGIPQSRKRLLTILTRTVEGKEYFKRNNTFLPVKTHEERKVTLYDAIGHLSPLEGVRGKEKDSTVHPLHSVPVFKEEHYFWVKHTKEGDTAFNNQCINPDCMYDGNSLHGTKKVKGINRSNQDTPLYCEKCGSILPRPWVYDAKEDTYRIMKGYTSAYKRMSWDQPASTLTQNFQYACSDNKLHPTQNRVLSIYEALILQTINDYDFEFKINDKMVSTSLIRDSIGESVPPKIIDLVCKNILSIQSGQI